MSDREYFLKVIDIELPRFERVFKAMPKDKLDYTSHPKNRTARQIATGMLFNGPGMVQILQNGVVDFSKPSGEPPKFENGDEAAEIFKKGMQELKTEAKKISDKDWDGTAELLAPDPKMNWKSTKRDMCWEFLHDLIHHRGQLTMYLRPMGGKVPSTYGPSGDPA